MTVRLRGHHLLCLLTYQGAGYSPAFIANFDRIVDRLNAGEPAAIEEGPDDICAPLLAEPTCPHCHNNSVTQRDRMALAELRQERLIPEGDIICLNARRIAAMRGAFLTGSIRTACKACEWNGLCTSIANQCFTGTRLAPDAIPDHLSASITSGDLT